MTSAAVVFCYSRCLWCGRRTPHQVCHAHGASFEPTEEECAALGEWPSYDLQPEECLLPDGHD